MTELEIISAICDELDERKIEDISVYDVRDASPFVDYAIIATIQNVVHCRSSVQALEAFYRNELKPKAKGYLASPHRSGTPDSEWVVLDFSGIVVHLVSELMRDTYALDQVYARRGSLLDV